MHYPINNIEENASIVILTPNLSIKPPPKNGKTIFGRDTAAYNQLYYKFVMLRVFYKLTDK
jgi:hypothetical protein